MAATGLLFVSGAAKKNEHSEEAGILGFEALANTLAAGAVTQLIAGRERPLEGAGRGRFYDVRGVRRPVRPQGSLTSGSRFVLGSISLTEETKRLLRSGLSGNMIEFL